MASSSASNPDPAMAVLLGRRRGAGGLVRRDGGLWKEPRLERDDWRPLRRGNAVGSRAVQVLCGLVGVGLLFVTVVAGYIGSPVALDNFAPTFVLITFWPGA
jgi:hypothetical protein